MNVHIVDFKKGGDSGLASTFNSAELNRNLSKFKTGYSAKIYRTGI